LVIGVCLINAGCGYAVRTNPLSAGLGDSIVHVGDGGAEANQHFGWPDVGFKYSSLSFAWLDLWTWDGTFCTYSRFEKKYKPISAADAARFLRHESGLATPFAYRFPNGWWFFGPLFLLAGISTLLGRVFGRRRSQNGEPYNERVPSGEDS
jgi:hypothetical protein